MFYLKFLLLILTISSCCGLGGGDGYYVDVYYDREIKVSDTTNRIKKISYQFTDKVFYPNDTSAKLITSENGKTTLFVETIGKIDTIELNVATSYKYYDNNCEPNGLYKTTDLTPKILFHTFKNVALVSSTRTNPQNTRSNSYTTDILIITP